jgi:hypothetical protein
VVECLLVTEAQGSNSGPHPSRETLYHCSHPVISVERILNVPSTKKCSTCEVMDVLIAKMLLVYTVCLKYVQLLGVN